MAYFKWADDMVIDEGPIDQDHRKLVELVNELHTATTDGRGQDIVERILDDLMKYTEEHLRREEAEMAMVNFPRLEQHRMGHAKFVEDLHRLRDRYGSGSITVAAQLSTVLRDWLSLHIRRSDKELRQFLLAKRGAMI